MSNNRRNRGTELGVLLLISHLMNNNDWVPPVTLGTVILQILIYMKVLILPFAAKEFCISGANILFKKKYSLLMTSALEHGDDMHLYYNMTSFTIKGRYLENKYGPINFALLLVSLIVMSSACYVATAYCLYIYFEHEYAHLIECAVGFSGVLFALKVIITREKPGESHSLLGFSLPAWAAAWAELILISLMVPNASFKGHLAGIVAGLVYTDTPVGSVLDGVFYLISGRKMYHNFRRRLSFGLPGVPFFQSSSSSSSSSYRRTEDRYRRTEDRPGRPPPYGFRFGNQRQDDDWGHDDWGYDYDMRSGGVSFRQDRGTSPPYGFVLRNLMRLADRWH